MGGLCMFHIWQLSVCSDEAELSVLPNVADIGSVMYQTYFSIWWIPVIPIDTGSSMISLLANKALDNSNEAGLSAAA